MCYVCAEKFFFFQVCLLLRRACSGVRIPFFFIYGSTLSLSRDVLNVLTIPLCADVPLPRLISVSPTTVVYIIASLIKMMNLSLLHFLSLSGRSSLRNVVVGMLVLMTSYYTYLGSGAGEQLPACRAQIRSQVRVSGWSGWCFSYPSLHDVFSELRCDAC